MSSSEETNELRVVPNNELLRAACIKKCSLEEMVSPKIDIPGVELDNEEPELKVLIKYQGYYCLVSYVDDIKRLTNSVYYKCKDYILRLQFGGGTDMSKLQFKNGDSYKLVQLEVS